MGVWCWGNLRVDTCSYHLYQALGMPLPLQRFVTLRSAAAHAVVSSTEADSNRHLGVTDHAASLQAT